MSYVALADAYALCERNSYASASNVCKGTTMCIFGKRNGRRQRRFIIVHYVDRLAKVRSGSEHSGACVVYILREQAVKDGDESLATKLNKIRLDMRLLIRQEMTLISVVIVFLAIRICVPDRQGVSFETLSLAEKNPGRKTAVKLFSF